MKSRTIAEKLWLPHNIIEMSTKSIGITGALNSGVTTTFGHYLSYIGMPTSTISSSSELSSKVNYPTVVRVAPPDQHWAPAISIFI
eukprot:Awhi_evm2s10906